MANPLNGVRLSSKITRTIFTLIMVFFVRQKTGEI